MNRIYKTRFNRRLGVWQAVPETALGGRSKAGALAGAVLLAAVLGGSPAAWADNLLVGAGGAGGAADSLGDGPGGGGGGGIGGGGGGAYGPSGGGGGGGGIGHGNAPPAGDGVVGGTGGGTGDAGGAGGASSEAGAAGGRGDIGGGGGGAGLDGNGGGGGAIGAIGGSGGGQSGSTGGDGGGNGGGGGAGGPFTGTGMAGADGNYGLTTTVISPYTPGTGATYDFVGVGGGGGGGGGGGRGGAPGEAGGQGGNGVLQLDGVSLVVNHSLLLGGAGGGGAAGGAAGGNGGNGSLVLRNAASLNVAETLLVGGSGGGNGWEGNLNGPGGAGGSGTLTSGSGTTITVGGQLIVGGDAGATSGAAGTGTVNLGGRLVFGAGAAPLVIRAGSTFNFGNATPGGTTGGITGLAALNNGGTLHFNQTNSTTLAADVSGAGTLNQNGSGTTILAGANTYTGGTFVNAGTLSVNGSIVGDTTVNNGGTLGGSGTVGNVIVASGGALAPGNSIGTLTVNGNLAFAPGSIYRVETNATGAADRVDTIGTITINGGTVDVRAGGAGYQRNTRYTILSSGGSTTGRFAGATTNLAFLTPTLIYRGNEVLLNLEASERRGYASAARTPNQTTVANHLQGFADTPSNAAAAGLIQQIDNMTADQAAAAFESMAGSAHASASQVASALGRNFSASLAARSGFGGGGLGNAMNDLSQVRYASLAPVHAPQDPAPGGGLWAQALGAGGRLDADGNANGSRYGSSGFVLGYDQPVAGRWIAGAAAGYSTSRWNATSGDAASGKIESPQAGLYARYTGDRVRVRIDGTFARHDFTTDRTIEIASAGAVANSRHEGREWGLAAQVEMPIRAGNWELRPLAGVRHAHLKEDGFNETGPSPANLAVAERTTRNTLLSAGMHFVRPFNQRKGGIELRAVASHLAGDNDSPVIGSIAGQPGTFTAGGVPLKRDALALGATVSGEVARNVSAYLDADYETRGSGQDAWRLTAGVRVRF